MPATPPRPTHGPAHRRDGLTVLHRDCSTVQMLRHPVRLSSAALVLSTAVRSICLRPVCVCANGPRRALPPSQRPLSPVAVARAASRRHQPVSRRLGRPRARLASHACAGGEGKWRCCGGDAVNLLVAVEFARAGGACVRAYGGELDGPGALLAASAYASKKPPPPQAPMEQQREQARVRP